MSLDSDAEKRFMSTWGIIFDSDIKRYGMCLEKPEEQCRDSCPKFMRRQCGGAVLIRQAGGTTWMSRGWFRPRRPSDPSVCAGADEPETAKSEEREKERNKEVNV